MLQRTIPKIGVARTSPKIDVTHTIQKIGVTQSVPKIVLAYVSITLTPESHCYLAVAVC
jgi:hypothetical protein